MNGPYNWVTATPLLGRDFGSRPPHETQVHLPGPRPDGGLEVLDNQIAYIKALRAEVKKHFSAGRSPVEVKAALDTIK